MSCATTTVSSSPTSISRMSRGGDRPPKLLTRDEARRIAVNNCEVPRVFEKAVKIAEHLLWREHGELLLEGPRQEPSIGLF